MRIAPKRNLPSAWYVFIHTHTHTHTHTHLFLCSNISITFTGSHWETDGILIVNIVLLITENGIETRNKRKESRIPQIFFRTCLRGIVVNVLDCDIIVSTFEFQLPFNVHFQTNTLWKCMNPFITPVMSLIAPLLLFPRDGFGMK